MNRYHSMRRPEIPKPEIVYELVDEGELTMPKSILILEDDLDLASLLRDTLQNEGHQVAIVANGAEGLKKIMASEFDVILCDMVMENFPGDMFYRAVERIRAPQCKRFIFMTGHKGNPKIEQFFREINGLTLWKPFEMRDLHAAIKTVHERK